MASQAEIEAAAKAMMHNMFASHEFPLSDALRKSYEDTAKAALEAAEHARWQPIETAPDDSWHAFAFFVSKCASDFGTELMQQGKTDLQSRNIVIGCFLDFAAGEACRIARREGREPQHEKWTKAVNDAFERATKRTASLPSPPESK